MSSQPRETAAGRPIGAPPGTLVAPANALPPQVRVMAWGPDRLDEGELDHLDRIPELLREHGVTWIDVKGLADVGLLERLGEMLGLHRLALEDTLNVHHRPKLDAYPEHQFLVLRMPPDDAGATQQLSVFAGERWELLREGDTGEEVAPFLRDLTDHVRQLVDELDTLREQAAALLDLHLSLSSHQQNEVMRVLTIFASVFLPLTFMAGIYGMNFDPEVSRWNMPELGTPYGYPVLLGVMAVVAIVMIVLFHRKGWFR